MTSMILSLNERYPFLDSKWDYIELSNFGSAIAKRDLFAKQIKGVTVHVSAMLRVGIGWHSLFVEAHSEHFLVAKIAIENDVLSSEDLNRNASELIQINANLLENKVEELCRKYPHRY